ncbi:hypothetical protein K6M90_15750 [Rhizobium sp. 9T]|uniref:hypothetical protein n=1 Tax=Rhizobium croatiense TaxID=2867516 RepID=UPI001C934BB9|nr:hypothetical protein [Rhizobium croatiense]MBY4609103.1 hypothetical protein [Rhizobium croatiense]
MPEPEREDENNITKLFFYEDPFGISQNCPSPNEAIPHDMDGHNLFAGESASRVME